MPVTRFYTYILLIVFFAGCNKPGPTHTITFGGDVLLDRGVRKQIEVHGNSYPFSQIESVLQQSDINLINFESTCISDSLNPVEKMFTFNTDTAMLTEMHKARINFVTLANNHSCDFGHEGLIQTRDNLSTHQIFPLGFYDTLQPCKAFTIIQGEDTLAIFTTVIFKTNCGVCNETPEQLTARIKAYKQQHPTHLAFAVLHWGAELSETIDGMQQQQAHNLINAGADAVVGHHPHVVKPIECYKGKYIFYSLGNLVFDTHRPLTSKGILAHFTIASHAISSVTVTPYQIKKCRPMPMAENESVEYRKKLEGISPTVKFMQQQNSWVLTE